MSAGDRPSLRQIFDEHARYVWRALRHLGVPESEVSDVSQEVFITVHRKLPEFEGRSSLRTWLYGICLRVASDHRRRAYVRHEQPTAEPLADEQSRTGEEADTRLEQRSTLLALLGLLDGDKREVLVLYEVEGFSRKRSPKSWVVRYRPPIRAFTRRASGYWKQCATSRKLTREQAGRSSALVR